MLTKKMLFTAFAACFIMHCLAQDTIRPKLLFDKDSKGFLVDNNLKSPLGPKNVVAWNMGALIEYQQRLIIQMKSEIASNIQTCIDLLSDSDNAQTEFYNRLWDSSTVNLLKNDLEKIKNALLVDPYVTSVLNTSQLYRLDQALEEVVNNRKYWDISSAKKNELIETNIKMSIPLHVFLTNYNEYINFENDNRIALNSNQEDLFIYYKELKAMYDNIANGLKEAYKDTKDSNLEQLYLFHNALEKYILESRFIRQLKVPYYKEWLWISGGNLKLFPLDFVTKNFVDTVTAQDMLVNSLDKKAYILRNKMLKEKNGMELNKIRDTQLLLNKVIFPLESSQNHQYLFYDAASKSINNEITKMKALDEKEKIFIVVHNLPYNSTIRLKNLETKKIDNSSPTEIVIDSAARGIVSLYKLINPEIGIISKIIGGLNTDKKSTVQPDITVGTYNLILKMANVTEMNAMIISRDSVNFIVPRGPTLEDKIDMFWDSVRSNAESVHNSMLQGYDNDMNYFQMDGIRDLPFANDLFDLTRRKFSTKTRTTIKLGIQSAIDSLHKQIIEDYAGKLREKRIVPIVIGHLQKDSVFISKLINIINYSSMPIDKLEAKYNESPMLRTSIEVLDQDVLESRKTEIQKITPSLKDTLALSTIRSKKGKSQIWDLSAGIAYTFVPIVVNEVTITEDSSLKVSSDTYQYRMSVGLHIYPFKNPSTGRRGVFKVDEPIVGNFANRFNFMMGIGIPKPLDNIYLGVGYDFGPGIKLNTGIHLHKYKKYQVANDEISHESTIYGVAAPFVSLGISPNVIANIIDNLF